MIKKIKKESIQNLLGVLIGVKSVFKDSGTIFAAALVGSFVLFVANILLAVIFEPELFGNFKTVLNLALVLPALLELGAGVTLTKYLPEFKDKNAGKGIHLINFFMRLRVIAFVIAIIAIYVFRTFIAQTLLQNKSLDVLLIAGLVVIGATYFDVFVYISNGLQKFRIMAASKLIGLSAMGIMAYFFGIFGGIFWAIIGWGIGIFIGDLIPFAYLRKSMKIKPIPFSIKKIFLGYSMPMYLMIIPNFVGIALVPILSLFFPQILIGYYSFALVFFNGIVLIPNSLYQVLLPKISMLYSEKKFFEAKQLLKRTLLVFVGISIIGLIGIVLFSKTIVSILAPKYLPGLIIFEIVIASCFFIGFFRILQTYYSAIHKIPQVALFVIIQNVFLAAISYYSLTLVAA